MQASGGDLPTAFDVSVLLPQDRAVHFDLPVDATQRTAAAAVCTALMHPHEAEILIISRFDDLLAELSCLMLPLNAMKKSNRPMRSISSAITIRSNLMALNLRRCRLQLPCCLNDRQKRIRRRTRRHAPRNLRTSSARLWPIWRTKSLKRATPLPPIKNMKRPKKTIFSCKSNENDGSCAFRNLQTGDRNTFTCIFLFPTLTAIPLHSHKHGLPWAFCYLSLTPHESRLASIARKPMPFYVHALSLELFFK